MSDGDIVDGNARPKIIDKTNFYPLSEPSQAFPENNGQANGKNVPAEQVDGYRFSQDSLDDSGIWGTERAVGSSETRDRTGQFLPPWGSQTSPLAISPQDSGAITAAFNKISGIHASAMMQKPKNMFLHWVKEVAIIVAISLLLSFVVKTFFFRAFYIPSGSMENTLHINDRIFVSLLTPRYFDLKRGDVVVFEDTQNWLPQVSGVNSGSWFQEGLVFLGLMPDDSQQHLIKRVIGMPGDRVNCCSKEGKVSVNGVPIAETYLYPGSERMTLEFEVVVPEGHVWVMGDHRDASADSRFHINDPGQGFIPIKNIKGKANAVAWPVNRWGVIDSYPEVFKDVPAAAP